MSRSPRPVSHGRVALALVSACGLLGACAPSAGTAAKPPLDARAKASRVVAKQGDDASSDTSYFPQQSAKRGVDKSVGFALDELPIGQLVDPTLFAQSAPYSIPADAKTPMGIEFKPVAADPYNGSGGFKTFMIRPTSFLFAEVRVAQQYQGATVDGSATVYCGRDYSQYEGGYYGYHIMPLHFEGLERKGTEVVFTVVDGWFDSDSCKVQLGDPTSTPLGEIIPGLLYGYRSCSHAGRPAVFTSVSSGPNPYPDRVDHCDDPDRVNFVFPRATAVATTHPLAAPGQPPTTVSRVTLPIRQGVGGSATASIPWAELTKWSKALDAPERSSTGAVDTFVMAIELQQTSEEDAPSGIVFLGGNDASEFASIRQRPPIKRSRR